MLRHHIWRRTLEFRVFTGKDELDQRIVAQRTLGRGLWTEEVEPALGRAFPTLFDGSPGDRVLAGELRMVSSSGYVLARDLHRCHRVDERGAHDAGVAAMWIWMAAGVVDHLIDARVTTLTAIGERLNRDTVAAAVDPDHEPPAFDRHPCAPELRFLLTSLERGFSALRARARLAPAGPHRDRMIAELRACVVRMVDAEMASPMLRLHRDADLDRVEGELRMVNTLTVWFALYAALLGEPRPDAPTLAALVEVATAIGELAWTLDALSDVDEDLEEGVWNRVWLDLARTTDRTAWLRADGVDAEAARAVLVASPVIDRQLARVETLLGVIEQARLPHDARHALANTCRLWAWAFLAPPDLK